MWLRLQLLLTAGAVGLLAWNVTSSAKPWLLARLRPDINPWAAYYLRPQDASLLNYVVLCIAMAAYGLAFQLRTRRGAVRYLRAKSRTVGGRFPPLLLVAAVLFGPMLNRHWGLGSRLLLSVGQLVILSLPWKYATGRLRRSVLPVLTLLLFCVVSIEPLRVMKGPVRVMNEFEEIFSDTAWNGSFVDNKAILDDIARGGVPQAKIDAFVAANSLEYFHQIASCGPFNHLGHVLNPLNEFVSGKAPASVYMQYGQGNTLLYKWTMDLFGGTSLQAFYRCYGFYVLYSALFILMLVQLFRGPLQVFNAFAVYAFAFFGAGYSVFIHAPGVIPTIHLLDATVFVLLLLYFRRDHPLLLASAMVLAVLGVFINRQFGGVLLISAWAATLPWLWEKKKGKERILLALLLVAPLLILAAPPLRTTANTTSTLLYFVSGYLSWRPHPGFVFLTVLYLAASYHCIFLVRRHAHPLKYALIFTSVYSQGLLTYFYWSGQAHHLMPVLPFVGLNVLLMLHTWMELAPPRGLGRKALAAAPLVAAVGLTVACGVNIRDFYASKRVHDKNFATHRVYHWDFERAKVDTTIDPEPFRQSIELIRKYSPREGSGIYLLTVYDNVLPFLAKRYSEMPFFEMQWFLLTPREVAGAIDTLERAKPEFLYVENGLGEERADPWRSHYTTPDVMAMRESRAGRRQELAKVFAAVAGNYRKVEEGTLLSVYLRR